MLDLDVILRLELSGLVLQIDWIEPLKLGEVEAKVDVWSVLPCSTGQCACIGICILVKQLPFNPFASEKIGTDSRIREIHALTPFN